MEGSSTDIWLTVHLVDRRLVDRGLIERNFGHKDVSSTDFSSPDVSSNGRLVHYFSLNGILLLILFATPIAQPQTICLI